MYSLGERIRARRKELGITQSQLGGADLTKGFISLVEKGQAKPSIDTLMLLARRLQKPVSYFLEEGSPLGREPLVVALQAGRALLKQGEFTQAVELFSTSLSLAQQQHDQNAEAECRIGLGWALVSLTQFDLATENVTRGKELAENLNLTQLLARASYVLGLIEYYRRNLSVAREQFLHGYRLLQELGLPDISLVGDILIHLGTTYQEIGNHAEAARWYREALTLLERAQDLREIGLEHARIGFAQRANGNNDIALAHLIRAEHIFEILEGLRLLAQARTGIGIMLLEKGEVEEAIAQLERSLRIQELSSDDPERARILTGLARALVVKRAFPKAEEALVEAERLTKRIGDFAAQARIMMVWAQFHRAAGHFSKAVTHYRNVIESFDRLGVHTDLARACNELGELLIEQKRLSEAAPYLARALQELNAHRSYGPQ